MSRDDRLINLRSVETGWRERNEDDFYESIYFVLCVANVNSELKTALSPKGSETRQLTPTFIEILGWI